MNSISIVEDLAKTVTEQLVHRPTIKDVNQDVVNFDHMKKQRERTREEERIQRVLRAMHNELTSEIVHDLAGSICGKYSSERAAREWSTVVKISILPLSLKPVPLSLSRSPLL